MAAPVTAEPSSGAPQNGQKAPSDELSRPQAGQPVDIAGILRRAGAARRASRLPGLALVGEVSRVAGQRVASDATSPDVAFLSVAGSEIGREVTVSGAFRGKIAGIASRALIAITC
jgi:hypothetical protein